MKPTTLLLAASLIANVAFVTVFVTRPAAPGVPAHHAHPEKNSSPAGTGQQDALRAALASGDRGALEAAGLSPELAREIALGRAVGRVADRTRASQAKNAADPRWWRNRGAPAGSREPQLAARRELADALLAAFGDDFGLGGSEQGQFGFLPPEKRDALRRILQDYDEMMAKYGAGGIQLASDKEKLRLLKAERDRDIAALLTPEERLAYEMRTSPTGMAVRNRYGDALETEEDFRKVYALQKGFEEKFPLDSLNGKITPDVLRQRAEAQRQLQEDIRAALGDDKYAAFRRAADGDLRNIDILASRLNLPPETTNRVAAARETFATESQRINADTSLPPQQRRAQIQDLAARARTDLTRTLGAEAADAYAQSSPWVTMLQNGMAFSTTANSSAPGALMIDRGVSAGVFPVLPAGATGGVANRQVSVNGPGAPTDGARVVDHVMTYVSTSSDGTSAPVTKQMIMVAPPPTNDPAPAPPK